MSKNLFNGYEVKVQLIREEYNPGQSIRTPDDLNDVMDELRKKDREYFLCVYLDSQSRISGIETVSIGTLNSSVVHQREVFKGALLSNACSLMFLHNHPSGETSVSEQDREITKKLVQSGEILGIKVLDHIIVGADKYLSMRRKGLIQ